MNNPGSVYNGNLPFIFVSYAHLNSKAVLPLIKVLSDAGYRIWFDQGIEAGTEWSNNIAAKLRQCSAFVFFASKQSVQSENCLDEVAYAKANKKPSLLIFLEDDVVLPEGTDMQTARFQRMYMSRQQSIYEFINNFSEAKIFSSCKDDSVVTQWQAPVPETEPQTQTQTHTQTQTQAESYSPPEPKRASKNKGVLVGIIAAIAVLLAAGIILACMFIGGKGGPGKNPEDVAINFLETYIDGDIEGMLDCMPEDIVNYMINSGYDGDRDAFIQAGEELFAEELADLFEMDIDCTFEVAGVKDSSKQEVQDFIENIDNYYDIVLDITDAASVEVEITFSAEALGEVMTETDSLDITVFKIDGKWYVNPESLEVIF